MFSHPSLHARDPFVIGLGVLIPDVDLLLFAVIFSRAQDARDRERERARLGGRERLGLPHPSRGFHLCRLNPSRLAVLHGNFQGGEFF